VAFTTIIALLAFGLQVLFGISPVLITIGTITLGVVLYFIEKNRTPNKEVNK
ncbi:MAG: hypothetical protein HUK24_03620, partial [Sphaerochaetaceae bacterium]|nr:hypothetical protein [Sphaerochaetaceae bacterium]